MDDINVDENDDEDENTRTTEMADVIENKTNIKPKRYKRIKYIVNGIESEGKVLGFRKKKGINEFTMLLSSHVVIIKNHYLVSNFFLPI